MNGPADRRGIAQPGAGEFADRCGARAYGRECLNPGHAHGLVRGNSTIRLNSRCRLDYGHEGAHSNALRDPDETCSWSAP